MMRRTLSNGDITLRPLVARDAGDLFMLVEQHRGVLRKYMNWVDRTTAAADVNYYILTLDGFWKAGLTYGVMLEDAIAGTVGFHHADLRNDRTEIGYWLAPPFHGRGIASRAVDLALDAAFQFTSVNRIDAKVYPDNKASIKLLEKLGFYYEGLERDGIKFGSDYRDHRIYSLLRRDNSA
jgi:RimJ/RimL family protein N-acetyltransferase